VSQSFEDQINVFKIKSPKHLQNWKKIKALENFSKSQDDINIWEELEFLVRVYKKGWLWPSQEQLLDDMITHYKIDYTKWAIKDGWVKMQLINGFKVNKHEQLEFWFPQLEQKKLEARYKMPIYSKLERHKLIQPRAI
jgi:hypothetical protein